MMEIIFPKIEERILKFWKKNRIFEKSVKNRPVSKTWTFLDGPPFVTGMPHYGTLLSSLPKDLYGRYWTMKGFRVRRVWGWDGHGLPIENKVENELKITRKKDIEEKIGIKKFINECRRYVGQVSAEWEWYIDRIGRWADFKNAYKTWDLPYMETVMWVFKNIYDKGFIYKGLRVSLYCPHCATPISNFEVAMDADNYKDIKEPASVYKYKLEEAEAPDTYFLAWSTTPWTKLATMALAVNPKLSYIKIKQGREKYILAKATVAMLKNEPYEVLKEFSGKDLIGKKFIPHYDFYKIDPGKKAYIIIGGNFVTQEEGTGIVTIAAYGEEDLETMEKDNIQIVQHLDDEGKIKPEIPGWSGIYFLEADPKVNADLKERGLLYKEEEYLHSVPTCWRCHTRLIYAPQNAWYIDIQRLKKQMAKTNESINWFPNHFKKGRFLKSLEVAPDWCISRSRYWGSPVPVWECQCGQNFVPGSLAELQRLAGKKTKIKDLHRPEIDEIKIKCRSCGRLAKRVPEVLDSWIEAGSASFGERHYPFEKNQKLKDFFPPDFIAEYTGQIRAWFYVLHVISNAIFCQPAFKSVAVTGVILGTDGRKMSKNYGNYPDPKEMLKLYGGDALRLYLLGSPVMKGEDILISEQEYRNQVLGPLMHLWNVFNFLLTYAEADNINLKKIEQVKPKDLLDRWALSLLNNLIKNVTEDLEKYDSVEALKKINGFIDDLSNWYIRRSRKRVGPLAQNKKDKVQFYSVCRDLLVSFARIFAPLAPFISEEIFKNLTDKESVHLEFWPKPNLGLISKSLEDKMKAVREISAFCLSERKNHGIKVRQPLSSLTLKCRLPRDLQELVKKEVNVKKIILGKKTKLDVAITPELAKEGIIRDIIRQVQEMRKEAGFKSKDRILVQCFGDDFFKRLLSAKKSLILQELFCQDLVLEPRKNNIFDLEKEMVLKEGKLWIGVKKVFSKKS